MITNKEYKEFLKKVIACVSYGDYNSVKEYSTLTLQKLESNTSMMEKDVDKYIKTKKCKKILKHLDQDTSAYIMDTYIEYLTTKIKEKEKIKKVASLEEFMQKMQ